MSKYILEIEFADTINCEACPLSYMADDVWSKFPTCAALNELLDTEDKPSNCPLKPVEEKEKK